jgi:FkbM family methyltransferase
MIKDFTVWCIHSLYRALHFLRKILLPSFNARNHKIINGIIGRIMGLKVKRIKTTEDISLNLDEKDSLSLSFNRVYEPEETALVKKIIHSEMRIIDIGANIGYYTTLFSKLAHKGSVYAFEPDESNFQLLKENCSINKCSNAKLFRHAIGNDECSRKLFLSEINFGDHRLYPVDENRSFTEVKMVTIDGFLGSEEAFDFIKMDIQGFEMEALKGMQSKITSDKPIILLEVWPAALLKNNTTPVEIFSFLNNLNYEIFDVENTENKILPSEKMRYIESIKGHTNILCTKAI